LQFRSHIGQPSFYRKLNPKDKDCSHFRRTDSLLLWMTLRLIIKR